MRKVWILLAVAIALAAVAAFLLLSGGSLGNFGRGTTIVTDKAETAKLVQVFVRNPYKDDYELMRVAGTAKNLGTTDIAKVEIEVRLLEETNRREIVAYTIEDVPAGATKSFDANAGAIAGRRTAEVEVLSVEVYR